MSETPAPAPGAIHTSEDEQILHKLGYAQELFRAMGGFQNFAISFTIISILAGCLTSYYIAFLQGGPIAVTWGWLLVGLMSTIVALSMAEIASAYRPPAVSTTTGPRNSAARVGLVHGLVQPRRPDRGHRRNRLRARHVRHGAPQLLVRVFPNTKEGYIYLPPTRSCSALCAPAEPAGTSGSHRSSTRSRRTGTSSAS